MMIFFIAKLRSKAASLRHNDQSNGQALINRKLETNRGTKMQAFHNDATIKSAIMAGLAVHRAADELVQGSYWENGKGCAVGCTLETIRVMKGDMIIDHSSHKLAETETGIPQILWRLEDCIFEGLPNAAAKGWPEQFTDAIRPGADLAMIWPRFALWLLTEELPQFTRRVASTAALAEVAVLYREWCESGKNPNCERWIGVRENADAAAYAADAADAAAAAAYAAAYAADSAAAAAAARYSAYGRQAAKLIELLEAA
jgi:hypothetical protein